ncbi:hypothetical protein AB205_0083140, partial [Aquarana catesbeiana]
ETADIVQQKVRDCRYNTGDSQRVQTYYRRWSELQTYFRRWSESADILQKAESAHSELPVATPLGRAQICILAMTPFLSPQGSGVLSLMVFPQHCPLPLESWVYFPECFPGLLALSLFHSAEHAVWAAVSVLQGGCQSSGLHVPQSSSLIIFLFYFFPGRYEGGGRNIVGKLCWQALLTST